MSQDPVSYVTGGRELLNDIGPLWRELNRHHAGLSPHFSSEIAGNDYERRKQGLLKKPHLFVILAQTPEGDGVGYCVNSAEPGDKGEIESIYIKPPYRRRGVGAELMQRSLAWLNDEMKVTQKIVGVAAGNEQAYGFYAKFGFYPRAMILTQKHAEPDIIPPESNCGGHQG